MRTLVVVAAIVLSSVPAWPQTPVRTVWDGVFAVDQAERGGTLYRAHCAACHGETLTGTTGPSLTGESFFRSFEADTVQQLFSTMRTRMPQNNPGILREDEYLDLASFVLRANGFPPGTTALTAVPAELSTVRIVRRETPREVANFSLVSTVGCLVQSSSGWSLASASAPALTKNPAVSKDAELDDAKARGVGGQAFDLMFVTMQAGTVASWNGHLVEAKGLLIRGAPSSRLNLTSVQSLAASCR